MILSDQTITPINPPEIARIELHNRFIKLNSVSYEDFENLAKDAIQSKSVVVHLNSCVEKNRLNNLMGELRNNGFKTISVLDMAGQSENCNDL